MQQNPTEFCCRLDQSTSQRHHNNEKSFTSCSASDDHLGPPSASEDHCVEQLRDYLQRYMLQNAYAEVLYAPTKEQLCDPAYSELVRPVLKTIPDNHMHQASHKQLLSRVEPVPELLSGYACTGRLRCGGIDLGRLKMRTSALLTRALRILRCKTDKMVSARQLAALELIDPPSAGASRQNTAHSARNRVEQPVNPSDCVVLSPPANTRKQEVRSECFTLHHHLPLRHLGK
jgi:hypothetical protein